MIADAIDTMLTLGRTLLVVATIVLLAAAATGAWAWRAAWRALAGARSAARTAKAPISLPGPQRGSQRRPAPRWALQPNDYEAAS